MNTTPASLLERLRRPGDEQAWGRFVELYTPLLYFWARRMGCQESDAADFVQEALALLVRKLPEFTSTGISRFVHGCARSRTIAGATCGAERNFR